MPWERIFAFVINDFLTQTKDQPSYTRRKESLQKMFFLIFSMFQCLMMQIFSLSLSQVSLPGLISPSACRWRQCREWGRWPQIFRQHCWWSKVGCSLLGGRQRWSYLQLLWSRLLLKRKFNIKDVLQFYWMKYNFWWSNIRIQREEDINDILNFLFRRHTFNTQSLLILSRIVDDRRIAGALGVLCVEIELDGDSRVQTGHLKYWNFVGNLILQLHLLSIIKFHQKISWKTTIKT